MNNNWQEYIYTQLHRESCLWARQCCSYKDEHAKEGRNGVVLMRMN